MPGSIHDLWWGFLLLGLAAGLLSGTLGLGSGILLVPALVLLFHFPQKSAQGMALAVMVPMAFVGALRYKLHPEIPLDLRAVALVVIGAVLGALLGSHVAARLPAHVLRKLFAVFLIVVAARLLLSRPRPAPPAPTDYRGPTHESKR
jgi:uncharacterized membrane protein YfcA